MGSFEAGRNLFRRQRLDVDVAAVTVRPRAHPGRTRVDMTRPLVLAVFAVAAIPVARFRAGTGHSLDPPC